MHLVALFVLVATISTCAFGQSFTCRPGSCGPQCASGRCCTTVCSIDTYYQKGGVCSARGFGQTINCGSSALYEWVDLTTPDTNNINIQRAGRTDTRRDLGFCIRMPIIFLFD
jgi:hypothetical protein